VDGMGRKIEVRSGWAEGGQKFRAPVGMIPEGCIMTLPHYDDRA